MEKELMDSPLHRYTPLNTENQQSSGHKSKDLSKSYDFRGKSKFAEIIQQQNSNLPTKENDNNNYANTNTNNTNTNNYNSYNSFNAFKRGVFNPGQKKIEYESFYGPDRMNTYEKKVFFRNPITQINPIGLKKKDTENNLLNMTNRIDNFDRVGNVDIVGNVGRVDTANNNDREDRLATENNVNITEKPKDIYPVSFTPRIHTSHMKNNSINFSNNRPFIPTNPYVQYSLYNRLGNKLSTNGKINIIINLDYDKSKDEDKLNILNGFSTKYSAVKTEADTDRDNYKSTSNSLIFDDYLKLHNKILDGKTFKRISSSYRDKKMIGEERNKAYKIFLDRQVIIIIIIIIKIIIIIS